MKATILLRGALALLLTAILLGCGGSELLPGAGSGERGAGGAAAIPPPDLSSLDLSLSPTPQRTSRGGAELLTDPLPLLQGSAPPFLTATGGEARSASATLPQAGLPPLPQDGPVSKQTSVAYTDSADPGAPTAKSDNSQAGLGKATLVSSTSAVSWVYYGIPTYATKASATATVTGSLPVKANGFKSGVFIAVANYTLNRWDFFPNIYNLTAPATVNFTPGQQYISPGQQVYLLLAGWNGDVVEITGIETTGDDSNVPPTAALTVIDDLGYDGFTATLDAGASTDSDLTIVQYEFDLDDGNGFVDNGANPVYAAPLNGPGGHLVQVRVTDEGGLTDTAQGVAYAVAPGSFLPLSWYRARLNTGLGLATMGMEDVLGPGQTLNSLPTGYFDMRTKLPGWFDAWYADPEGFPEGTYNLMGRLDSLPDIQALLLEATNKYTAANQITEQSFNPALDAAQPLAAAIASFVTLAGGTPNQATYQAAVGSMPLDQQQALARVVLAGSSALVRRNNSFGSLGFPPEAIDALFTASHGDPSGGLVALDNAFYIGAFFDVTSGSYLLAGFPYGDTFFTGAAETADALDQLRAFNSTNPPWADVNLTVDTPAGQIKLAGTGADTHAAVNPDGHAVLIDLGGADVYDCHAGGNASGLNPVALCIDFGSDNDTYNRIDDPDDIDRTQSPSDDNTSQQGAGRVGIGMLVDFGGDDTYASVRLSQGCGVFGVGLLADLGGVDSYDMEALGQGAGFAGIGLLLDEGGNDGYTAWHKCQGFGGLMGVGILADRGAGGDNYFAVPDADAAKPEYGGWLGLGPAGKNLSLCQGAAIGCPNGLLTVGGANIGGGGGYGLLFDGGGDDFYTAGGFAQGCGFFECCGLLVDVTGADSFDGFTFTQGAAGRKGVGCLFDFQGIDGYTTAEGQGLGGADQFSIAWLLDHAGADTYDAAGIGLGAGQNNGMGYFVDWTAGDSYSSHISGFENTTLGRANLGAAGDPALTGYGIFVDDNGADTYALGFANMAGATLGLPGDSSSWVRLTDGTYTNGRGSGIDVP